MTGGDSQLWMECGVWVGTGPAAPRTRTPGHYSLERRSIRRTGARAFSWLKAPTSTFTFKTLLRHYTKETLTKSSCDIGTLMQLS